METEVTGTKEHAEVKHKQGPEHHEGEMRNPNPHDMQGAQGESQGQMQVQAKPGKNGKMQMLEPIDLSKVTPGRKYELSINEGPIQEYKLTSINKNTGDISIEKSIPNKGATRVHINADKVKISRFKSKATLQKEQKEKQKQEIEKALKSDVKITSPEDEDMDETALLMIKMIQNGIHNIWMVGPAGCGKSTIARIVTEKLGIDIHVVSCGIGTSSTEFIGYKYPEREKTPFSDYYVKPSIIVLDEFTALDPSVAQIANAALANDELYTTTGLIKRHPNCAIVATSNTFGTGGDMSYVANNQLDASTIDRFVGGIIEVGYSSKYEARFDDDVLAYVLNIRDVIKHNGLQRIASTRMIQGGIKLKEAGLNWRRLLIQNWTPEEQELMIT